jgi:hypothetical protein
MKKVVRVSPKVAKQVMSAHRDLSRLGVEFHRGSVKRRSWNLFAVIGDAWLIYSILKEARGNWSAIREVLVDVGLSRYEITTLKLSQYTRKKPVKKKKR